MKLIIILINQATLDKLVFPLAALIKQLPMTKIHMVPVTAAWLADENNLREEIREIKVNSYDSVLTEESTSFYLLDIGPADEAEAEILHNFSRRHAGQIRAWIASGFTAQQAGRINLYGHILTLLEPGESLIQGLARSGCNVWQYLHDADCALRSNNRAVIATNDLASRYLKALEVCRSMTRNFGDDDTLALVNAAVMEFTRGRKNSYLDSLAGCWNGMRELTDQVCAKLKEDFYIFRLAKHLGRPVGYADLGRVPGYIDIPAIMRIATKKFPYLVVLRFRFDDEECVECSSSKFDVNEKLRHYAYQDTVSLLHSLNNAVVTLGKAKEALLN